MKKILLLLLLFAGSAYAQVVIPDANFKAALLATDASDVECIAHGMDFETMTIDADHDGEISQAEADAVYSIILYDQDISSVVGLQSFTNLRSFACDVCNLSAIDVSNMQLLRYLSVNQNHLTTLDLTTLPALEWVQCGYNNLTALDVAPVTTLTGISCNSNPITSLNITTLPNLGYLAARSCELTELDVTHSPALYTLDCGFNHIPSFDFSNCLNLNDLTVASNPLSTLDVSMLVNLEKLYCEVSNLNALDVSNLHKLTLLSTAGNHLTTLDCSHNPLLVDLYCFGNNMETLFIKNGSMENNIDFGHILGGNALQFICADDAQINSIQTMLDANSNTTTLVGSYCSFTPGGDFNTITGTLLYDNDNNGCGVGDLAPFNLNMNLDDGNTSGGSNVNASGNYSFYTGAGNFTVTPQFENPGYFTISPASAVLNFPLLDNSTQTQDFCITANGAHPDLEIAIAPMGLPRPGFTIAYKIVYKNKGTMTLSGTVNFGFDSTLMEFLDSTVVPDNTGAGTLTYNFTNLPPFGVAEIYVTLGVNAPTDTPPVVNGDTLTLTASITGNPNADDSPDDNASTLSQLVVGSFDPNNKICIEGEYASPSDIGKYLHYNINFENTGTADAENIVVKDVIDTTKFDISTLQVLESSHPLRLKVSGNTVEFIFEGIDLSPSTGRSVIGGHGNVLFKIKTLPSLNVGDSVTNTAGIFFDYNFPIVTNEARTTFAMLNNAVFAKDESIGIYPNPASDFVQVKANSAIKTIEIYDVQGRILQHTTENKDNARIDVSTRANGIYFLKITTATGSKVRKLVKG